MFAGLFEEETGQSDVKMELGSSTASKSPPPPRNHTQLCGLSNLGATCYLNSLLQTLHYTPEFREALFSLGEDDLGVYSSDKGADNSSVRLIPVQLQKLFARLLILNQQSTEVSSLTGSFGWNNSEELQQHDVQELNRILFAAIESSLLGTQGQHLIGQLYHGTSVQQVHCCRCSRVSERVEEFQDIQVPLSGRSGLEQALKETYIDTEVLQGSDQYWCEGCQQLVDAVRSCRLKKLPHVLTFGLLRFLYNFQKGERCKDTSKFKFPLELDMAQFCDTSMMPEEAQYELFSVVIHRGSTHSGHYTAFIRDVDDLGVWQEELDQVQTPPPPPSPAAGQMDFIDCETPSELIQMVIQQLGGSASVAKLCKALQENTGVSWNTRFKKQFGSIQKFLRDCPSLFHVDDTNQVTLKESVLNPSSVPCDGGSAENGRKGSADEVMDVSVTTEDTEMTELDASVYADIGGEVVTGRGFGGDVVPRDKEGTFGSPASKRTKRSQPPPPSGYRWFEFNDAQVSPTTAKAIEKLYQGKQSAYMLFYRRRSLKRPLQARGNPLYGIPEQLLREVVTVNSVLDEERAQHNVAINTLKLNIHFLWQYQLIGAALQRITEDPVFVVRIDRRKPFSDLKASILEVVSCHLGATFAVNIARHLAGGVHLYDTISGDEQAVLSSLGLSDETHLFVWNGIDVGGKPLLTGKAHEPLVLHFTYSLAGQDEREMDVCVAKSLTLGGLREYLAGLMDSQPHQLTISQVRLAGRQEQHSMVMVLPSSKDKRTLDELGLSDGDRMAAEKEAKKGVKNLAHIVADKQNKLISVIVEDRCSPLGSGPNSYPVYPMETSKDEVLSSLKKAILTKLGISSVADGGRLRFDDDNNGLGPPLYENQTLSDAGLVQGQRVIMEPGPAPQQSEIVLYFSTGKMSLTYERVFDNKTTVKECCLCMQERMDLKGSQWHLRKTNWCSEPAELLDEETATLAQEKLKSGDTLIVEEGRLPPKGFVQLSTFLYSPHSGGGTSVDQERAVDRSTTGREPLLQESATTPLQMVDSEPQKLCSEVPLHLQSLEQFYPPVPGTLLEMGCVELSKDATVEDLKNMILTLPAMQGVNVPSSSFLRVQELVDGRPGKILKVPSLTLRRSKLTSSAICCTILPYEETLSISSIVFNVCIKNTLDRSYGPPMEVVYDSIKGCEPHEFSGFVARLLGLPSESVSMAKHKYETFEWIKIAGLSQDEGGRRRKVRTGTKASIKNTPIFLHDGDTVGIKYLTSECGDRDDFSTPSDDRGRAILASMQEEKKKRRRNKGADIFCSSVTRRPEVGIKIFVPDYSSLRQTRQS